VAVGLERTHAEGLGEGESLSIECLGLLDLGRLVMHGNLTEQMQGIGLVSTLLVILGEAEGMLSTFERILDVAGHKICLITGCKF